MKKVSFEKVKGIAKTVGHWALATILILLGVVTLLSGLMILKLIEVNGSLWGALMPTSVIALASIAFLLRSRTELKQELLEEREMRERLREDWQEETEKLLREISVLKKVVIEKDRDSRAAEERIEKLLNTERETSQSLRKSNETLNEKLAKLSKRAEQALEILAHNTVILRAMDPRQLDESSLKELRFNELNAAIRMFEGLGKFTWWDMETMPNTCRDYVFVKLERNDLDLTQQWARDLVRYVHGGGIDIHDCSRGDIDTYDRK